MRIVRLRSELGAATGTTTLDHESAALGCHASAEAVSAGAFQKAWLKGSFHDDSQ